MFLFRPRFFALPLITLTIIMSLPRQDTSADSNSDARFAVGKTMTCKSPLTACTAAASPKTTIR
jgi:hypothetical protein